MRETIHLKGPMDSVYFEYGGVEFDLCVMPAQDALAAQYPSRIVVTVGALLDSEVRMTEYHGSSVALTMQQRTDKVTPRRASENRAMRYWARRRRSA